VNHILFAIAGLNRIAGNLSATQISHKTQSLSTFKIVNYKLLSLQIQVLSKNDYCDLRHENDS
jgi:hypothetical protein